MSSLIKLKRSAISGNVPTTSQLELGEIALNTNDGKIFIKKDDGSQSIVDIGNWTYISDKPDPTVTVTLTGDLGGTGSATLTDLANGTISVTTELTNTGVTIGTYGSATTVGQFTVDEDGRITSASSVNIEPISSLAFDTANGVITLTDTASNAFAVDLGIGTGDSPQFNDITVVDATVTGNLTVQGTTTTVNQTTLTVNDSKIFLADGNSGDAIDIGLVFNYNDGASDQSAMILRDATDEKIKFVNTYDQSVTSTIDFAHSSISYATIVAGTIEANVAWDYVTNRPDPNIEVVLTGTVVGSANATLTDLANGSISVPTSIPTTTNLTLNNLVVSGDLTVQGTTTEQTVVTLTSESPIFILNSDAVSEPDIGMVGAYNTGGANTYSGIFRDGSDDKWKVFDGYTVAVTDSSTIDITDSSFSLGTLVADTFEGNLDFSYIQNKPDPNVEVVLTGDVTGSANTTLTDLANGSISVATTLGDYLDIVRVANTEWIDFQTTAGIPAHQEGRLFYDDSIKALSYYNEDADLIQSLGVEEMQRVYNNTGVSIPKGSAVYFSGAFTSGTVSVPTVALAIANDMVKFNAQGIMAEEIATGGYGYIQVSGIVKGIDTSALTVGENFFVSPDTEGAFQTMPPTYPNFPQCLGLVLTVDANNGVVSLNQQNHSIKSFRVVTDTHIGGDLILGGNLTVLGSQTIASTETIAINNPFTYVNGGDTIGILNTSFSGTGLDDASLTGKFTGPVATTYYVRIDGVGTGTGGVDTFEWSLDNFVTTVATGVDIDGTDQLIHSTDNIAIKFEATTGHTLGDTWTGTAAPSNVDTGFITNRNTGQSAPGFTYMGLYFDVSQGKWVLFDEFDTEPSGAIDTSDASFSYAALKLDNVDADNIDIGTHIDFASQISDPSHQAGRVFYSNDYKALTVYNDITGSSLQVGHEEWVRVYNNTGSTIPSGTPVYDTGAFGETITVAPADATTEAKAAVLGIATHDILTSSEGVVTVRGLVSGINTASLTVGSKIHLAPNGTIQNAAPTYPYYPTDLGWCVVSDATDGYIYVTIEHHTYEQFRITGNQHIDGNLTVDGDLTISGTQSIVSSTNLSIDDSFIYIGTGDAIGESGTTFSGSGLDDAYFRGYFEGAASTTYYVRIDGVGTGTGGVDTFEWSTDNFVTTQATGVDITGATQALSDNISIFFNATTGHTSGDTWSGTAAPVNVDSGWVANRNTGATGVGYTHMGVFFDVSDNRFKFFDEYDPEVTGDINVGDASFSYANVAVDTLTGNVIGNLTGDVTGNTSGNAGTVGGLTASQFLRSDANDTATGVITFSANTDHSGWLNFNAAGQNIKITTDAVNRQTLDWYQNTTQLVTLDVTGTGQDLNFNIQNAGTEIQIGGNRILTTNDTEWLEDSANTIFQGGTYITKVHADASNTITFNHDATTRSDTTGTATSLGYGDTFTVVTSTTSNATGHLTAIETTQFTLPSTDDTDTTYSMASVANTAANAGLARLTDSANVNTDITFIGSGATTLSSNSTAIYINSTDTNTTYTGGTYITLNGTTFDHDNTTTTPTTTGNTTLAYSGSFTTIDGVTVNATGHVTGINTKTVTLPASDNTNTTYDLVGIVNASNGQIRLSDSANANDDLSFAGSGGVAVSSTATTVTIDGSAFLQSESDTLDSVTGRGNTTTNNITVNDMTVSGNLTVNGTTTTLNVTNLEVDDAVILLNASQATPTNDIGLIFQRYSTTSVANTNVGIIWDEGADELLFGTTQENASDTNITIDNAWLTVSSTGNATIAGNVRIDNAFTLDANEGTSTTASTVFTLFAHADFGAAKVIVTAKDGSDRQITELLITHDGTTAVATEYGGVYTNSLICNFGVAINGANVELTATSVGSASGVVYNIVKTLID